MQVFLKWSCIICIAMFSMAFADSALARGRYLNPTLGRFMTRDPIGDQVNAQPASTQSPQLRAFLPREAKGRPFPNAKYSDGMSLYQYIRSSPSNFTDPSGLEVNYDKWWTGWDGHGGFSNRSSYSAVVWGDWVEFTDNLTGASHFPGTIDDQKYYERTNPPGYTRVKPDPSAIATVPPNTALPAARMTYGGPPILDVDYLLTVIGASKIYDDKECCDNGEETKSTLGPSGRSFIPGWTTGIKLKSGRYTLYDCKMGDTKGVYLIGWSWDP